MKSLGYMKVALLPLMILGTTMGSSIALPIPPAASPTLDESTSCRRENPEEESEESPQSQTGREIMEVLPNLNKTLEEMARILSKEKSSPSTAPLERSSMRKQDSYSSMEF